MPGYHSKIKEPEQCFGGNIAFLTFRTKYRGPVLQLLDDHLSVEPIKGDNQQSKVIERKDIIEESFYYFKSNVFLKSYEISSTCDRILIYVTLYIIECLKCIKSVHNRDEAAQLLYSLAITRFDIPGDPAFPLNHVYGKPKSAEECDMLRQYLIQLRSETGKRLLDKVFEPGSNQLNKWWMCFSKRKFMNLSLT